MSSNPGIVNLVDTPPNVGVQAAADPVFGLPQQDGSLGKLGHYKILKQLGCGGMGAVYLAQDEGLERRLALKVMLPSAASDPMSKERFLREARASAAVKHDNVVTIYQVGEDRGIPFIAMEYLAGTPLDHFLARKGRLTIPQALRVGLEAAEGLAAAHTLGMIHRDIKPANIWLEAPRGRIKILDFGIARKIIEQPGLGLTNAGTVVGTPGYMSPEQARGKQLDPRSDLFSLGVVLYQLTTGRMPFEGESVLAVLTALAVDDPIPVRSLNPEVPPQFEALIHRMLAKRPDSRPPSALTVAAELHQIANGAPIPVATAVQQTVPQVIYVPIAVTSQESFNPTEFDGLGDDATEAVSERELAPAADRSGKGLWIAVGGGLLFAVVAVAGTIIALEKPTKPADPPDPSPSIRPIGGSRKVDPPPRVESKLDPSPTGRGLRFAPEQSVVIPGLIIPEESPYTLEGFVTVDESFKITSPVFGTKYRLWAVISDGNQGLHWEGFAGMKGPDSKAIEVRLDGAAATRGRRTHIALVRSRTDVRLFVDGKRIDTKPLNGSLAGGGLVSMGGEKFAGIIDEFRVSDSARYDIDFTPPKLIPERETLALYLFDEGQGNTLRDISGHGRDCNIGATRWASPTNEPIRPLTNIELNRILPKHLLGHLTNESVSDQEMRSLRAVKIDFFDIGLLDDIGFEKLSLLPWASGMRGLDIRRPDHPLAPVVTDAGLAHITAFKNMHQLKLTRSNVSDAGLKPLASLASLKVLHLNGTRITSKAATALGELRTLGTLDISNTAFGDDGLKGLTPLTELGDLRLENTPVTDEGLTHLHGLNNLKSVNVKGTKVTAEGVKKLEVAIPGLKVQSDITP